MSLEPLAIKTDVAGDAVVGIASGQSVAATQGTPAAVASGWPVKITDGTDTAPVDATNGLAVDVKNTVTVTGTVTTDTELPAAAALADAAANPTTPTLGAGQLVFNGTTWDRARGDITNGLDVDVTRLPALAAGTNNIGDVDVLSLPALPAGTNNIGDVDVVSLPALAAGTNVIGKVGLSDGTDEANIAASNAGAAVKGLETLPAIVASATPSLTDGRSAALSMDTAGRLRTTASVTPSAPTAPTVEYDSGTAIAPAGTDTLDSTSITANTKKLRKVVFSATAQCKADLVKLENAVESAVLATLLTSNVQPIAQFDTPHDDFITITNSAGADNFRLKITNLEPAGGGNANVFATFFVNE